MPTFGMTFQRNGWTPRSEQFYNRLLSGLEDELLRQGHTVIVKIVSDRDERATFAQWAVDGSVDAVVCKDITVDDDLEQWLGEIGLRYVVLGDATQQIHANAVTVDNAAALREVLDHLRAAGRRRIDWLCGPSAQWHTHARRKVFESYVSDGLISGQVSPAEYDENRGRELITAAMRRAEPPTAFLIDGDYLATVAIGHLRKLGHQIPEDVSLVSWDDSLTCQRSDPPLSALDHLVEVLGAGIARCLIAAVEDRALTETGPRPRLVVRESTA